MGAFLKEFREFAVKGNVVDMAVGLVIGAAFTNIVNSLVNDVMMPLFGFILGGVDFSNFKIVLASGHGETVPEVSIKYGFFINKLISFIIVAFSIFLVVKILNRLRSGKNVSTKTS